MTVVPKDLLYTKEHEWVKVDQGADETVCVVGITDYAQAKLGDIVVVDLPKTGSQVEYMKAAASIESFKAVSDVYAPLSGAVVEVNAELSADPGLVNREPYGKGWLFKIKPSKFEEEKRLLVGPEDYEKFVGEMK
jgi:glycine cleavage system H protein